MLEERRESGNLGLSRSGGKAESGQAILPDRQIYQAILRDSMYHYKFTESLGGCQVIIERSQTIDGNMHLTSVGQRGDWHCALL